MGQNPSFGWRGWAHGAQGGQISRPVLTGLSWGLNQFISNCYDILRTFYVILNPVQKNKTVRPQSPIFYGKNG